ncbi:MAG TPA: PIN domain nuclease, partial [Actinobacteria bacterium]|nr:PIN domain nuclease [Actinomycetota bacterium]
MEHQRIIVDTSVWIEYFKNNQDYVPFIEDSLNLENILITGLIISELLHGIKSEKEYKLLLESISAVPYVECIYEDWVRTGEILYNLKKKGRAVPLTDVLISAIAIRYNASVLTLDKHFKNIARIKLITL